MNDNKEDPQSIGGPSKTVPPQVIQGKLAPRKPEEMLSPPFRRAFRQDVDQQGMYLRHFLDLIWQHKGKIALVVVLGVSAAIVGTLFMTPLYKSSVKINVERRGNNGLVGQQGLAQSFGFDMDQIITTQVEVLKSDSVLRPATEKYDLLALEDQFKSLKPDEAARLRKAPIHLKRLKVARVPNTYLVDISYQAPDPQLAADVANAIAASYVDHAFDSRDRSYVRATAAVERHLQDLQQKMADSGKQLTEFNKNMNIIDPEKRVSILSARLLQLDTDYTAAQSDRLRKEAVLNSTRSGMLAAAQVSTHADILDRLIENLDVAREEFAVTRSTYAENHPEYKRATNKVAELERQFRELRTNTLQQVQEDYNQALTREQMAYKLVGETKNEVDTLNNQAFDYEQLKSTADNDKRLYEDLERITREEDINRNFQDSALQVEDAAHAAAEQTFPVMWLNIVLGFLVSGVTGIAGVILYDTVDLKLRSVDQIGKLLNVDVIASLPRRKRSLRLTGPRRAFVVGKLPKSQRTKMLEQYQESIRALRNNIDFANGTLRSVLVTSAGSGEGKSTIASNLAFSYALLGKKVLIIDADMRCPSQHKIFEKTVTSGLAELLERRVDLEAVLVKVAREHLFLLPAGLMSDRSADLVTSELKPLLAAALEAFDLVIIDGPPLLNASEAAQLAAGVDGVLVCARVGSPSEKIAEAYRLLFRAGAKVLGMVLDDVRGGGVARYGGEKPISMLKSA